MIFAAKSPFDSLDSSTKHSVEDIDNYVNGLYTVSWIISVVPMPEN